MKTTIVIILIVSSIAVWLLTRASTNRRSAASAAPTAPPSTNVFADLRAKYFTLTRNASCPKPSTPNEPWGAMMEIGYPEAVVTTVAFTDGTASILRSSGGGFFGGGTIGAVKTPAEDFLQQAKHSQSHMTPTHEFPQPSVGHTVFYLFTDNGIFSSSAAENDLRRGKHQLSELSSTGLRILHEYLQLQKQQAK